MKAIRITAAGVFLLITASCAMKQDVELQSSGSGRVRFDISLAGYLTEVIAQAQTLLTLGDALPEEEETFFDLPAIREDFRQQEGVELLELESPTPRRLTGELSFNDIRELLQSMDEDSAESRLIHFDTREGVSELAVVINRETVVALLESNPSFNNPLVETFGPATTEDLTDDVYLDMMEFALGEESRLGIQESALELTVRVEGRILEQSGGEQLDDRTVRYRIPLLDLLLLSRPLTYTLRYE